MNERIKLLRKELKLTQQEFGDRLGLKRSSVALIELGRNTSEQTIISICREFNVNEEWLRFGTGEMFKPQPTNELDLLAAKFNLTEGDYAIVKNFVNLPDDKRQIILDYILKVASDIGVKVEKKMREPMTREELHAELDRQLDLQKEAREKF